MDVLRDEHARLRLKCQHLAAVDRLVQTVEQGGTQLTHPKLPVTTPSSVDGEGNGGPPEETERRIPLLFFERPLADPRMRETVE